MSANANDDEPTTAGTELADRIVRELLYIARQWVVLRFLVEEEIRQGGDIKLGELANYPVQRQAALLSVISELFFSGLIEWNEGMGNSRLGQIRPTLQGRQFVDRILAIPQHDSIQHTMDRCRCANLPQLLDTLERVFHRLDPMPPARPAGGECTVG